MSFSKNVETMAGWDNLHEWEAEKFFCVTVEPLPSIKEYGEKMPEEDRLDFAKACMRTIVYHKARGR